MAQERRPNPGRIIQDPDIMVGKPVIEGTRIPVEMVLDQLAYKPDLAELFARFPDLTVDDVRDCLAYAQAAVARKKRTRRAAALAAGPGIRAAAGGTFGLRWELHRRGTGYRAVSERGGGEQVAFNAM